MRPFVLFVQLVVKARPRHDNVGFGFYPVARIYPTRTHDDQAQPLSKVCTRPGYYRRAFRSSCNTHPRYVGPFAGQDAPVNTLARSALSTSLIGVGAIVVT